MARTAAAAFVKAKAKAKAAALASASAGASSSQAPAPASAGNGRECAWNLALCEFFAPPAKRRAMPVVDVPDVAEQASTITDVDLETRKYKQI